MVRRFVPSPLHYMAIRLNPTAMVDDLGLDDPETVAEAKALQTKTYLVYLVWVSYLLINNDVRPSYTVLCHAPAW